MFSHTILKCDCPGEPDDDHEELYKVANATHNASSMPLEPFYLLQNVALFYIQFYISLVWWLILCRPWLFGSIFASISLDDASYLKQQVATGC